MRTIHIKGLGDISRHSACQVYLCDAVGFMDSFTPADVKRDATMSQFTDKEIRNALDALVRSGEVKRIGSGTYGEWRVYS